MFGVRHETDDVACFVRDSGDVAQRPVRVEALVAEDHASGGLELVEHLVGGDEPALTVLQRNADRLTLLIVARPRGVGVLHEQILVAADEVLVIVSDEGTGQQTGLAEDLEAVADAEHRHTGIRRSDDGLHDRGESGDRTAAQVVTVGESARQDDGVDSGQSRIRMPQVHRVRTGQTNGASGVTVIKSSGKRDDSDGDTGLRRRLGGGISSDSGHDASSDTRTATTFSITGFDRSFSAASRA